MNLKTIALALTVLTCAAIGTRADLCSSSDELDECTAKSALLSNREVKLPRTLDEAKALCVEGEKGVTCLENFLNDCIEGPPKPVALGLIKKIKKNMANRCHDDDASQELLDAVACLDTDAKVEEIRKCSDKHLKLLEIVADSDLVVKASGLCCGFYAFKDCMTGVFRRHCGDAGVEYFKTMLLEYSEEISTVACTQFNTMEKCAQNLDHAIWDQMKPVIDADLSADFSHHYKTPAAIMYKLLEKFKKH